MASAADRRIFWTAAVVVVALDALRPHIAFIEEETLARCLELGARAVEADVEQEMEIDGRKVVLGVRRYEDRSSV